MKVRKFSKSDSKNVIQLRRKKLLEKYVKSGMEYNEDTKAGFIEFLRKNNITLSKRTAHFILKRRINRYRKRAKYDLEFDEQLTRAIAIINK